MTELILIPLCFYAAVSDFLFYKIPNWLVLGVIAGFLLKSCIAIFYGAAPSILFNPLIVFTLYLSVGFLLFAFKVIGAGDAKLLAACSLWLPSASGYQFIVFVSLCGGILAIIYVIFKNPLAFARQLLLAKIVDNSGGGVPSIENKSVVPYAIAIFAGLIWTLRING